MVAAFLTRIEVGSVAAFSLALVDVASVSPGVLLGVAALDLVLLGVLC